MPPSSGAQLSVERVLHHRRTFPLSSGAKGHACTWPALVVGVTHSAGHGSLVSACSFNERQSMKQKASDSRNENQHLSAHHCRH